MMWHKSILVSLLFVHYLSSGEQLYQSFSTSLSIGDRTRELTSAAKLENTLWFATKSGHVFTKEQHQGVARIVNEHQSREQFPASVATFQKHRVNRVCFGSDILHFHASRETSYSVGENRVTTLTFSPTGNHLLATLFSKPSSPNQRTQLVAFDVQNGSLPEDPLCSVEVGDEPIALCKVNKKGNGNSIRIAMVEGKSTIRIVHGELEEGDQPSMNIVSTHAPLYSSISDLRWYSDTTLCLSSGKKVSIKSCMGGDPTFSLTASVGLGPIEVIENNLIVGTCDGRIMILNMEGNALKTLSTFVLSQASQRVCQLIHNSFYEPPQLTCLVKDKRTEDEDGDFFDWPPRTPEDREVKHAIEFKQVDRTLNEIKSLPKANDPLPNAACKRWSCRIGGGSCLITAVSYFLYWLTYCTHQSEGTWCP